MNVFILSTGRAGSMSFERACRHITNYSAGHETRSGLLGQRRFDYPQNHIESDNRLAWLLGRLEREYGDDAVYVHLIRDPTNTANSFASRANRGIMRAYRDGILLGVGEFESDEMVALDYVDTVNENIRQFLRDKTRAITFELESVTDRFHEFWDMIDAEGDYAAAVAEFQVRHNARGSQGRRGWRRSATVGALRKVVRIARTLPAFVRQA